MIRLDWRIFFEADEEAIQRVAVSCRPGTSGSRLRRTSSKGAPCGCRRPRRSRGGHGPVHPRPTASGPLIGPTLLRRSRKIRFLRSIFSPSSTRSMIFGRAARHRPLKSFVGGCAIPPMRPNECVIRAPVSSSRMSQTISRALTNQRNGVKAPSSIAIAPSQVRWSLIRASSPRAIRYHWHRSGTTRPQSFSTASA